MDGYSYLAFDQRREIEALPKNAQHGGYGNTANSFNDTSLTEKRYRAKEEQRRNNPYNDRLFHNKHPLQIVNF